MLSLAELTCYFKARAIKFQIEYFSREFFTIKFEEPLDASIIDDLGGTIKIAQAEAKLSTETLKEAFQQKNKQAEAQLIESLVSSGAINAMGKTAKVFFGVSIYCSENSLRPYSGVMQRFVGSAVKRELAGQGKKARFMGFSKDRKQAQLSHVEVLKKGLVETKAEVLLCIGRKEAWIGTTVAVHDPFEFQ